MGALVRELLTMKSVRVAIRIYSQLATSVANEFVNIINTGESRAMMFRSANYIRA